MGFPRNLGGTVVSASYNEQPAGAGRSIPWPADARVHRPLGTKQWTEVRYRVARETEASGTSDSGQSILMVPVKQGNPPQGSLWRERGCREAFHSARAGWIHEPWRGKMSGPSKPGSVSTKLLRIAELGTSGSESWPEEPDARVAHVRICEGGRGAIPSPYLDRLARPNGRG